MNSSFASKFRLMSVLLASALTSDCALAATVASKSDEEAASPSLTLTIKCTNSLVKVGDEISIEFLITNRGTNDYEYANRTYDRSGRMDEYALAAKTASGKQTIDPRSSNKSGWIGGGLHSPRILHPGESATRTIPLNRWALIKEPGQYQVVGTYLSALYSTNSITITSASIVITVLPRSEEEMDAYIGGLTNQLAAQGARQGYPHRSERDSLVMKLMFTCSPKIVPTLLDTMYEAERGGFWEAEALQYYVPRSDEVKKAVLSVVAKRGLASGMQHALTSYGCGREDFLPLIKTSLALENPRSWQAGALAAQQYCDDTFTPRLIALATEPKVDARIQAVYALALNRTDEGVKVLKALLVDPDSRISSTTENAIQAAYCYRGNSQGRPLKPDDFDKKFQRPDQ